MIHILRSAVGALILQPARDLGAAQAHRHILGEGKVADLGLSCQAHAEVHQALGVWSGLAQEDVEDVAAIDYGEEDMLELCPLEDGDVCAGGQVGAVGVVDGKVARLMPISPQRFQVALNHPFGTIPELLVDEVGYGKALSRGLGGGARKSNGHAMLLGELLGIDLHLGHGPDRQLPGLS